MAKKEYLQKTLNELAKNNAKARFIGVRIEKIFWTIERKAQREIDRTALLITICEMIEEGTIIIENQMKRIGGPDGQREEIPHYRLA